MTVTHRGRKIKKIEAKCVSQVLIEYQSDEVVSVGRALASIATFTMKTVFPGGFPAKRNPRRTNITGIFEGALFLVGDDNLFTTTAANLVIIPSRHSKTAEDGPRLSG